MFCQQRAKRRQSCLSVFILLFLTAPLYGLEPPTKSQLDQYRRDGTLTARIEAARQIGNHLIPPERMHRLYYNLDRLYRQKTGRSPFRPDVVLAPPPNWSGMPTKGTVKVLGLLIEFNDYAHIAADTVSAVTDLTFGSGTGGTFPYESLYQYYYRSSFNQLTIQGNLLGWYTTAYNRSTVVQTPAGREALIKEVLNHYNGIGHDFTQYDNDGDGSIDYFFVIWTGPPGTWASFWWGQKTYFWDGTYTIDGKTLSHYSWQWESFNYPSGQYDPLVLIHETGHALGLPDYYDYNGLMGPGGGIGHLDMMDANRADHNCFSKFLLEWLTPTVATGAGGPYTLRPAQANKDALVFMPGATSSAFGEFFMVQNRQQSGNDNGIPGTGLLIWHVDSRLNTSGNEYIADNSFTDNKLLRLMEADGLEEIETGDGNADAGDFYTPGTTFGAGTIPNSLKYDRHPCGLGVNAISYSGSDLRFSITDVRSDTTPPAGVPASPLIAGGSTTTNEMNFMWPPVCSDPESGIATCQLLIGSAPGDGAYYNSGTAQPLRATARGIPGQGFAWAKLRPLNGADLTGNWSIDMMFFNPAPSLNHAVDNPALIFTGSGPVRPDGAATWYWQSGCSKDSQDAAASGTLADSQSSRLDTAVSGPGVLTFWWKVDSETNCDYLRFFIDSSEQHNITGNVDWVQRTYVIGTGNHTLRWEYSKNSEYLAGWDRGWVDQVTYTFSDSRGDANNDGSRNQTDVQFIANYLSGQAITLPSGGHAADMDGNTAVNLRDLVIMQVKAVYGW